MRAIAILVVALYASCAFAQDESRLTLFLNGHVLTVDRKDRVADAVAVRGDRIVAVGTNAAVEKLKTAKAKIIDLDGRTMIPGLMDSHLHALRDGQTYAAYLDWSETASVEDALRSIAKKAESAPEGSWIVIPGGWQPNQFKERRAPTTAELNKAAPRNPVYLQLLYNSITLNAAAVDRLKPSPEQIKAPAQLQLNDDGSAVITANGNVAALAANSAKLPKLDEDTRVKGLAAFMRKLNSFGMTAIFDGGGSAFRPDDYAPVFDLRSRGEQTIRIRYTLSSPKAGSETTDVPELTKMLPPLFGDEWFRFEGPGEVLVWGMHDGSATAGAFTPKPGAEEELKTFLIWAAQKRYPIQIHASQDASAGKILDIIEGVARQYPIADLRWALLHIEDASDRTLDRMKTLNMGWGVQDRLYFAGDDYRKLRPADIIKRAPPIVTALHKGVHVAGGTDAFAISPYNPFRSLKWFLDGKTIGGAETRDKAELPTRMQALRIYTMGSAWLSFDEKDRGSIEVGKLADLAVLTADYLKAPLSEMAEIHSVLTMVGGRVVYGEGDYRSLEEKSGHPLTP